MKAFREEVEAEIEDQSEQNKDHIEHYQTVAKEEQQYTHLKMETRQKQE